MITHTRLARFSVGVGILTILSVMTLAFSHPAKALNTYSIDLESGSSQYLSISDASQTGLDLSGDFTIEAWVKIETAPGLYSIASKYNTSGNQRSYIFYYQNDGGTKELSVNISSAGSSFVTRSAPVDLGTGTWHHIAFAYTAASGNGEFFVDGSSIGSVSGFPTSIYNSSTDFSIGGYFEGSAFGFFDGLIDDVRVWNVVRTQTEISDDMSRELNGNESGLVGYWKLNNSLSDSSLNGNTLTNNGSAAFSATTPFSGFNEVLKVRKSTNESVANSTVLQNDDDLKLSLAASKTYAIDGVLFASSTSATPDINIAFFGQTGSTIRIGYTNDVNEMVLDSGEQSARITLPANTPTSIHIHGTVVTGGVSGDLQLKWAQVTSNSSATTVLQGSYLRAEEI